MATFKRMIPILWLFVSFLGLAGQLYQISDEYLRFDVITNVQIRIPEKVDLPVIHFCNYLRNVMDWKKVPIDKRRQILTVKDKLILPEDQLDNITLIEDKVDDGTDSYFLPIAHNILSLLNFSSLFDMTIGPEDIFDSTISYDPDQLSQANYSTTGNYLGFGKFGKFSESFKDVYKCYRFDLADKYQTGIIYKRLRQTVYRGGYASYMFKRSNLKKIRLSLIFLQSARYPDMSSAFFTIELKERMRYFMSYNEYQISLLPPPYVTKCLDYSTIGYASQGDCLEKCLRRKTLDAFSKIHPIVSIRPGETEKVITRYEQSYSNYSFVMMLAEIEIECNRFCGRRQCDIHEYIPKLLCTVQDNSPVNFINAFVTMSPIIQTITMPQLTIIQFVTNLASAFGFWIGMSVLGIEDALKLIIKMIKVRGYRDRKERLTSRCIISVTP